MLGNTVKCNQRLVYPRDLNFTNWILTTLTLTKPKRIRLESVLLLLMMKNNKGSFVFKRQKRDNLAFLLSLRFLKLSFSTSRF